MDGGGSSALSEETSGSFGSDVLDGSWSCGGGSVEKSGSSRLTT